MNKIFGIAFADTSKVTNEDKIPGTNKDKVINLVRRLFELNATVNSIGCGFALSNNQKIHCGRSKLNGLQYSRTASFKQFLDNELILEADASRFERANVLIANMLNRTSPQGKKSAESQPIKGQQLIGVSDCVTRSPYNVFLNHINHFTKGDGSDSEAFFKLFDYHYSDSAEKCITLKTTLTIRKTLTELSGKVALACISKHEPYKLILMKTGGDLYVHYYPVLGFTLFGTDEEKLIKALDDTFMPHCQEHRIDLTPKPYSGLVIDIIDNQYTQFSIDPAGI